MPSSSNEDKGIETANVKKISLKKYVIKVFMDSTYPTDLEIAIDKPTSIEVPAYTFCNDNPIMRTKFCAKYPDHCTLADKTICKRYPHYCRAVETEEIWIPKKEYYLWDHNMTLEEFVELGQNLTDFFNGIGGYQDIQEENVEGPFLRTKGMISGSRLGCYSINSLVDSPQEAKQYKQNSLFPTPVSTFKFNVQPDEILVPGDRPGILFSVHSQYEAVNPFERGIFMKAGRSYKIYVNMEREILLPLPYKTNCTNYTEDWLENNRIGPRSKKMCVQKCFFEFSLKELNCTMSFILYPTETRICSDEEMMSADFDPEELDKLYKCIEKCKDNCLKTKRYLEVQERYEREFGTPNETMEESGLISVEIYLDMYEVVRFQHRPQYRDVELFSVIGGFIGVWLGVSLVQVVDLLESLCRIFTYICRKKYAKE
ncbi:uncharacterized protein LOC118194156 isoform X2 [Stegodyphus dumicola]|uniref:uncharacterized protein LOC118194156 isoform X2 n=1 Tax=Stegodyphus dumicola TaxID=202533 RepID=UPI0015B29DAA|nr:uncharacterized protein LOC118194156 isoform X2 [Stegodyphus dumicola]